MEIAHFTMTHPVDGTKMVESFLCFFFLNIEFTLLNHRDYCLEWCDSGLIANICLLDSQEFHCTWLESAFTIGMIVSVISLILTLMVYTMVSELRTGYLHPCTYKLYTISSNLIKKSIWLYSAASGIQLVFLELIFIDNLAWFRWEGLRDCSGPAHNKIKKSF